MRKTGHGTDNKEPRRRGPCLLTPPLPLTEVLLVRKTGHGTDNKEPRRHGPCLLTPPLPLTS